MNNSMRASDDEQTINKLQPNLIFSFCHVNPFSPSILHCYFPEQKWLFLTTPVRTALKYDPQKLLI